MQAAVRMVIDCREFPTRNNCSLTIAGTEGEVIKAAIEHAISSHGQVPGPELVSAIRTSLREERGREASAGTPPAGADR